MRCYFKLLALAAALLAGPTDVARAQGIGVVHGAAAIAGSASSTSASAATTPARTAKAPTVASATALRPAASSTTHGMWAPSTSLAAEALFAVATTPAPTRAAMHQRPASTASPAAADTPAQRPGGQAVAGGGVFPPATPATPAIFTATHGPAGGGVLEYGSCLAFESQCSLLCSNSVHSMGCADGGLCLCDGGDRGSSSTATTKHDDATELDASEDSAAHARLRHPSAWGGCAAAAALVALGALAL
ncbi:hypothetical protein H4R21_003967 [Coemansia helicoidea]|uniref:Uncharacterized protein n=1 Tax=Coemansia helicoidea TaxID=1286919 RepID=A0ACC1KZD3_9FUNG|nr:hypothetical protein H4R21_003967 [Coemansia helicoidea]